MKKNPFRKLTTKKIYSDISKVNTKIKTPGSFKKKQENSTSKDITKNWQNIESTDDKLDEKYIK